jgi:ech hydrogenase subunit D
MSEEGVTDIRVIEIQDLMPQVDRFRSEGWRIVQVLCVARDKGAELTYSFGMKLELRSLRLIVGADESVPSITSLYPGAFLYENEIRDLYGVRIERIRADWEGRLYDVARERPFSKVKVEAISSEGGSR